MPEKLHRKNSQRSPDNPDDHALRRGEAAARRRRFRFIAIGIVLCGAVIGYATWSSLPRNGAESDPDRPATGPAHSGIVSATPSAPEWVLDLSRPMPVPHDFDQLKRETLAMGMRLRRRYHDSPEGVSLLAWMYDRFGETAEATRCWEQWLKQHPDSAEAHFRLGRLAKDNGDEARAADYFRAAFQLAPSLPGVQIQLGELLNSLGKGDEAVAVLETELQATRANPNRLTLLGFALLQTQQYDQASEAFRQAMEIDPKGTHAIYGLATACAKLGHKEEAKKYFDEFASRKGQGIVTDRARATTRLDDLPRLLQIAGTWYTAAGKIHARAGDLTEAERHWLRAAAINPADQQCRLSLIELYRHQGKRQQAARLADEIRRFSPRQEN